MIWRSLLNISPRLSLLKIARTLNQISHHVKRETELRYLTRLNNFLVFSLKQSDENNEKSNVRGSWQISKYNLRLAAVGRDKKRLKRVLWRDRDTSIDHWFAILRSSDSRYMCVCVFAVYHKYDDYSDDRFRLLQTRGYCQWKRRVFVENRAEHKIRFPIGAAAEEITLQPFSRARRASYFYFILSRTFGLSTRALTHATLSPFCYFVARGACARDDEIK